METRLAVICSGLPTVMLLGSAVTLNACGSSDVAPGKRNCRILAVPKTVPAMAPSQPMISRNWRRVTSARKWRRPSRVSYGFTAMRRGPQRLRRRPGRSGAIGALYPSVGGVFLDEGVGGWGGHDVREDDRRDHDDDEGDRDGQASEVGSK